jgi:hypothetical protein
MRLTEFLIVIMAALMFLIPTMNKERKNERRQLQEEEETWDNQHHPNPYLTTRVLFESRSAEEEGLADIMWMRKAAKEAMAQGSSYFNVLKQRKWRRFNPRLNRKMIVIEGEIELEGDPMKAEYHASDIPELPEVSDQ